MVDLIGRRFGSLVVVGRAEAAKGGRWWHAACDCGGSCVTSTSRLQSGHKASCGCAKTGRKPKHGLHADDVYHVWQSMIKRCRNPKAINFERYGGRGIKVCARWSSLENFKADMGPRPPGASLERVDNSKGYEPSNCRWATVREQTRNKRSNRLYTIDGTTMCLQDWCAETGLAQSTVWNRLNRGWSIERALGRMAAQE